MDFCRVLKAGDATKGEGDVTQVIVRTHRQGEPDADHSPLQMVSAEQVAYWQRIEREYLRLLEGMAEKVEPAQSFKTAL